MHLRVYARIIICIAYYNDGFINVRIWADPPHLHIAAPTGASQLCRNMGGGAPSLSSWGMPLEAQGARRRAPPTLAEGWGCRLLGVVSSISSVSSFRVGPAGGVGRGKPTSDGHGLCAPHAARAAAGTTRNTRNTGNNIRALGTPIGAMSQGPPPLAL